MSKTNVAVFDNLGDVYWKEFKKPTKVVIKNGDSWHGKFGTIIRKENIISLKIEKPGLFSTSEDGKMLFAKDTEENGLWLTEYFGRDANVVIPEGVRGINAGAFQRNNYIKTIRLPKSIRIIGEGAFMFCENLRKVNFPEGLEEIWGAAFEYTDLVKVTLPASLDTIGMQAFRHCTSLESVTFRPDSKITILYASFSECTKLSEFCMPDHLRSIYQYCFEKCQNLDEVHLPNTVVELETGTLSNVRDLYLESIPRGVISAVVNQHVKKSCTFTVHYKGANFIFPREIQKDKIRTAETLIRKTKQKYDASALCFAKDQYVEALSALETYNKYGLESAKKMLKETGIVLIEKIGEEGNKERLLKILKKFEKLGILNREMLSEAKDVCDRYSFTDVCAYVMDLAGKTEKDVSLEL